MMMYYDARPGGWCGLFDTDTLDPTKPYYTYYLYKELPKLGGFINTADPENVYSVAATNGSDSALFLTYYNDDDDTPGADLAVTFTGNTTPVRVDYYLLDDSHDGELTRSEVFTAEQFTLRLTLNLFDTYLIKLTPIA